ncbi:MAG: hypothetical protein ACI86H_000693 [bacterium]|jgi:hypothetical protein
MKKIVLISLVFLFPFYSFGKEKICKWNQQPQFSKYKVKKIFRGKGKSPNFSKTPKWKYFRTALRYASKRKVNFAGKYIVTEWGCGSACQAHALLNSKTGRVYDMPITTSLGIERHPNSRLIIADPLDLNEEKGTYNYWRTVYGMPRYYLWNEKRKKIQLLCKLKKQNNSR